MYSTLQDNLQMKGRLLLPWDTTALATTQRIQDTLFLIQILRNSQYTSIDSSQTGKVQTSISCTHPNLGRCHEASKEPQGIQARALQPGALILILFVMMQNTYAQKALEDHFDRPYIPLCSVVCSFLQTVLFLPFLCFVCVSWRQATPQKPCSVHLCYAENALSLFLGEESRAKYNTQQQQRNPASERRAWKRRSSSKGYVTDKSHNRFWFNNMQKLGFGEPKRMVRRWQIAAAGSGELVPGPHPPCKLVYVLHTQCNVIPIITQFISMRLTRMRYLANPLLSLRPWASSSLL